MHNVTQTGGTVGSSFVETGDEMRSQGENNTQGKKKTEDHTSFLT
jgi:hypothetical protein